MDNKNRHGKMSGPMRTTASLLAFLGLIGAALVWRLPTPEPPCDAANTATILGQVTRHGFPVAARVEIRARRSLDPMDGIDGDYRFRKLLAPQHTPGPPLRVVEVGPDGECRIADLPIGEYRLRIFGAGGDEAEAHVRLDVPGAVHVERLEIGVTGREVRGRATWSDGRPFLGEVSARGSHTTTGPEGRFRLARIHEHASGIVFRSTGRISREFVFQTEEPLVVVVDEGLGFRMGRVVAADSGAPIGGARVLAGRSPGRDVDCTTLAFSRHDGGFRILMAEGASLQVHAAGYHPSDAVMPTDDLPTVFRLDRSPVVTGVVRDSDGEPVAGVTVALRIIARHLGEAVPPRESTTARTDRDGRFRIESPVTGDVTVSVLDAGWVSRGIEEATVGAYNPVAVSVATDEVHELDQVVVPSPSIAGRVLDHEGRPVAGIRVAVEPVRDDASENRYLLGWSSLAPAVATDADGRFRFPTLFPGVSWKVEAWPWASDDAKVGPVTPVPDGEETVEIRLPPPWRRYLVVRVVEEEGGAPITGATVDVRPVDLGGREGPVLAFSAATTGPDGRVRIGPLADLSLTLDVNHPTHVFVGKVPVADNAVTVPMARGCVLAGRVVMPDGAPVSGRWIHVRDIDGSTRLDGDGRFRREDLPPGFHHLRVSPFSIDEVRYTGTAEVEAGREDVLLTVIPDEERNSPQAGPEVCVRVVDERGRPVEEGTAGFLRYSREPGYRGPVSRAWGRPLEGGCATHSLDADEETVWVDVRPADPRLGAVLAGPFPRDVGTVTITVRKARRIAGVILGPDDQGIRGVRVFAWPENEPLEMAGGKPSCHGATYTASGGRFVIDGLGPGPYHLWASGPGRYFLRHTETAMAGDKKAIVRMLPAAAPTVTVVDELGRPVVEVDVRLYPPDAERPLLMYDAMTSSVTDRDGRARFKRLDPERAYLLVLSPPYNREDLEERQVGDWAPESGTFRLRAARVLRGIVRDRASGNPIGHAALWYRETGKDTGWEELRVGADGTFETVGVPWTPLVLRAGTRDAERDAKGNVEVQVTVDGNDLEIQVEGGRCLTLRIRDWPDYPDASATVGWDRGRTSGTFGHGIPRSGVVRVFGLSESAYYSFYAALPDGRMVHATKLPATKEHVLDLQAGKEIRVKLELPAGYTGLSVYAIGGDIVIEGKIVRSGEYAFRGLPDGRYLVSAWCRVGQTKHDGSRYVIAGEDVKLALLPRK